MLISQMLQVNVDTRFTAEEVLAHPWVTVRVWIITKIFYIYIKQHFD